MSCSGQVRDIEAFAEPAVDRAQQAVRLCTSALKVPAPREIRRCAQGKERRPLLLSQLEGTFEGRLARTLAGFLLLEQDALNASYLLLQTSVHRSFL